MVEISILIAIVGCFVGLAGWLSGRDKKISSDGEWRGTVNSKLDTIHTDITGIGIDLKCTQDLLAKHGERLTAVEASARQAHKRLDEFKQSGRPPQVG